MEKVRVKVTYLPTYRNSWDRLHYAYESDSGFDLRAAMQGPITIHPGDLLKIPTGLRFEVPSGYELQIRPRSGFAQNGIIIPNSPGTIDSGYTGQVFVLLAMLDLKRQPYENHMVINPGMKIAQAVLSPVAQAEFIESDELQSSGRADNGFGSTGV